MNIRLTVILTILAMVVNATVIISKPIDGVTFNKAGDEHVLTLNIELPSCPQITAGPTDKDFAELSSKSPKFAKLANKAE